jgi:hypothetical protein
MMLRLDIALTLDKTEAFSKMNTIEFVKTHILGIQVRITLFCERTPPISVQ